MKTRALAFAVVLIGAGAATAAPRKGGAQKYTPLRTVCADTLADGTPTDAHLTNDLVALAATVPWTPAEGPPSTCHRVVHLTCGPDLDGDGDADAIVQVQGWTATDDAACETLKPADEHLLLTHTFLATRHHGMWRALGRLDVGLGEDDPDARRATFVRRAGGGPAIRVEWTNVTSESGCRIAGYEIVEWRAGALHRLDFGDNSRTCSLCDCSR